MPDAKNLLAMEEIKAVLTKHDLGGIVFLGSKTHTGRDPRIGGLSREDASRIKAFAESIGALDSMPAWMAREIDGEP